MAQFNWLRAVEGGIVTAIIAGAGAYQAILTTPSVTSRAIVSTVLVTGLVGFIKGVGQSFGPADTVQTTITQPAGTTAVTETVASVPSTTPPPTIEVPHA